MVIKIIINKFINFYLYFNLITINLIKCDLISSTTTTTTTITTTTTSSSSSAYSGSYLNLFTASNDNLNLNNTGFEIIFSDDNAFNYTSDILNNKQFDDLDQLNENNENLAYENPYKVYSLPAKVTLSILAITASLITVSGNLLVMFSFFLDRQIRNPTNYFILSLSVSDFIIGLVSMPFLTLYLMVGKWPFGEVICNLWLSLDYTVCLTSIYTVLFITIDRFCSVKIPAKYRKWRSPNKIIVMVMLTWVVPISLFFTSIFAWSYTNKTKFDPKNCDVAWSSNKIFSVTLVFSYFWTTLIVIIVLYIFIYQVARNLEKKSREKQRKLSSLVGCSATNTGALVGVVVMQSNLPNAVQINKKAELDIKNNLIKTKNTTKLDPTLSVKRKRLESLKFNNKKLSKTGADLLNNDINKNHKFNHNNDLTGSSVTTFSNNTYNNSYNNNENSNKSNNNNSNLANNKTNSNNNNNNTNFSKKNTSSINKNRLSLNKNMKTSLSVNNCSYASTLSREDEFSSSYDSHSDYDNENKHKNVKKPIQSPAQKAIINSVLETRKGSKIEIKPVQREPTSIYLQPRPESLAVMSHDQFVERCASSKQSSAIAVLNNKSPINSNNNNNDEFTNNDNDKLILNEQNKTTIPFIDEEFDELSYILTRRQFADKESKIPIKEEKIIIKSPLRGSFLQKITTPIKNLSRRSSQKSISNETQTQNNQPTTQTKFDLLLNNHQYLINEKLATGVEVLNSNKNDKNEQVNYKQEEEEEVEQLNKEKESQRLKLSSTTTTSTTTTTTTTNTNQQQNLNVLNAQNSNKITPSSTLTAISSTNGSNSPCLTQVIKTNVLEKQQSLFSKLNSETTTNKSAGTNGCAAPKVGFTPGIRPMPKRKNKHENRARKALRTITFILGAFIFCFAPWHVVSIYNSFCPDCFDSNMYHHFFYSCYFLCYLNSPINPFMYALANQQFKKTFFRILKGDWRRL